CDWSSDVCSSDLFGAKHKRVCEDPEMFATYLTLAREACSVVKAHKQDLIAQVEGIIAEGVAQGAFEVADPKTAAAAIFDATRSFHHPAHADEWGECTCSEIGRASCREREWLAVV